MTAELWPCTKCGAPGVRNLGTDGYCHLHLAQLYQTFAPDVWRLAAVGVQDGPLRPDYGPGYADLRCPACGATWTGKLDTEPCWWCQRQFALMLGYQRELLLTPPDIDRDDRRRYNEAMDAWARRMVVATRAGVITAEEGNTAWRGECRRAA